MHNFLIAGRIQAKWATLLASDHSAFIRNSNSGPFDIDIFASLLASQRQLT